MDDFLGIPRRGSPRGLGRSSVAMMSAKERLAEAIAALPEGMTLEEAVERLYRAFKLKQEAERALTLEARGWPPGWFEDTTGAINDPTFARPAQGSYEVREGLG